MKKTGPRWSDTAITPGSGNIFIDLGFEPAEAKVMLMRADLMIALKRHMEKKRWTQAEAARRMGITQPRVSKLKKGAWNEFSLDMLLTLALRIGLHTELRLAA